MYIIIYFLYCHMLVVNLTFTNKYLSLYILFFIYMYWLLLFAYAYCINCLYIFFLMFSVSITYLSLFFLDFIIFLCMLAFNNNITGCFG